MTLQEIRSNYKVTQSEIGIILGISKQGVSAIETAKSKLIALHKVTLAYHFRIPLNDMFGVTNKDLQLVGISITPNTES